MSTVVIACKMIEREVLEAMKKSGCDYDILWLESGLHNVPKKLHHKLQELIDDCEGYDTVLLAMGFCGNALQGITTGDFHVVVPRVDDCISLLLGSMSRRLKLNQTISAYYLTEGWLKGERNIWTEYQYTVKKYGEQTGKEIFDTMFCNYHTLVLLDTGCYDCQSAAKDAKEIAEHLKLQYTELTGTLTYLSELLQGNWGPERFLVFPPHSTLSELRL